MQNNSEASRIRMQAEDLLRSGTIGNALVVESGHIETPITVQTPDGRFHSWFVPLTVGDQIAGFLQFLPDGTFMRFSSFQRRADDLAGCPAAADWLDGGRIQAHAESRRHPGETIGKPFLTYDRSPDRLAWAVPITSEQSKVRYVFVAGGTVYDGQPADTDTESYV